MLSRSVYPETRVGVSQENGVGVVDGRNEGIKVVSLELGMECGIGNSVLLDIIERSANIYKLISCHPTPQPIITTTSGTGTPPLLKRQIKRRTRRRNLNNSGPKSHDRVLNSSGWFGGSDEDVRLAADGLGDIGRDDGADDLGGRYGDGVEAVDEDNKGALRDGPAGCDSQGDARCRRRALTDGQARERFNGQGGVGAGAGFDEGGREREDRVQTERGPVGVRGCDFTDGFALHAGVQGFGDEDGACHGEVILARDESRAAEIG